MFWSKFKRLGTSKSYDKAYLGHQIFSSISVTFVMFRSSFLQKKRFSQIQQLCIGNIWFAQLSLPNVTKKFYLNVGSCGPGLGASKRKFLIKCLIDILKLFQNKMEHLEDIQSEAKKYGSIENYAWRFP